MRQLVHSFVAAVMALLVAALPEAWKAREPYRDHATVAAHVASAAGEVALSVVGFIAGLIAYVEEFSAGPGFVYLTNRPTLSHAEFFGVGVIAYLSYLLHPFALLALFCLAEGVLRALEAAVTGRLLGVALIAVPIRTVLAGRQLVRQVHLRHTLGPPRDDEVVGAESTSDGALWVFACRQKAWSDVQVVKHAGRFFILTSTELVTRGEHRAFLYRFRPLDEASVIRGPVVHLLESPAQPRPAT